MRDVWKYYALWPVAAGTLPPYWENGKMVEQAQNRRILTGRLTCAVHPLQTLLLCAQKEEVRQRVRVHGEGTERPCLYGINERNYRTQRTKKKPTDLVAVRNLLYLPLILNQTMQNITWKKITEQKW